MFIEVRPGEGGDDAANFAAHLVTAFTSFALRSGWHTQPLGGDSRTSVLLIRGEGARETLAQLAGTHRVQRVPDNDTKGRRQTSTATVAVLETAPAQPVVIRDADLRIDRMRGSGRGGQRRNKVETAVRVTHLPTNTVVTRLSGRSQATNIDEAKREIVARLNATNERSASMETQDARRSQVDSERSGKDFTHCWYRDEVVRHADGKRWTIRQWKQGRLA